MADYLLRDVHRHLADNGGVTSRRALEAMGVPRSTLKDWILAGRLEAEGAVALRGGSVPSSRETRLRVALLEVGQGAVFSHATAIRLWGLWRWGDDDPLEVIVDSRAKREPPGVRVHHTRRLLPREVTTLEGVGLTRMARCICDVAGRVRPATVKDLLADAASRDLVDLAELFSSVEARKRFPGRTAVRAALAAFDEEQARYRSKTERRSRAAIVAAGLPAPLINYPVRGRLQPYLLDHAWPAVRYDVELDGPEHLRPSQAARDRRRDADLTEIGWTVDRFPVDEVDRGEHLPVIRDRLRELGAI